MNRKTLNQLHLKLLRTKKTVAIAESCTGGLLSSYFTKLPGASAYFIFAAITYSNKSKEKFLNIPAKTIAKYGAVSSQVATLMAKNIRKKTNADFGLSITGIAGPTGGDSNKPTGTVFIGLAKKNKTLCRLFLFSGQRATIRKQSVQKALNLLSAQI